MTDDQHQSLTDYIDVLAPLLLLADWEFKIQRDMGSPDCYAQVTVWSVENKAQLWVGPDFWQGNGEEQREWLAHELIHCHCDRMQRVIMQLTDQVDDDLTKFARNAHNKEIEICVQKMARLLAPILPLPEWGS